VIPIGCYQRDGTADVPMYQLQRLRLPPHRLVREERPSVLVGETCLTDLVHLRQDQEAADQSLSPHLPQGLKIDVAETCVRLTNTNLSHNGDPTNSHILMLQDNSAVIRH
jgi:hypothetical protein